jgi:hypothetical protein
MATKAQSNHKDSTKAWPIPPHSHPNHLIKRGSQTTCNCKLGYHDSCTLCKGSALYPRVVISSLAKWLEKPHFCHSYTSFGVWPRVHYVLLQRSTTGVCHALLRFPDKQPHLQCWGFPHKVAPFAPCGSGSSHRMSQRLITKIGAIPTQPSMTHIL